VRSALALGARVLARLFLPLLLVGASIGPVAAGDEDEYADEAAQSCSFLPPNLPTVSPFKDTGGCSAYDKAWPDIVDAWSLSISWYGNVIGNTPAGDVQRLGQELALPATTAYGEAAVEGESDDPGYGDGTHHVIEFARGLYVVHVIGRPADAAKGQAYAKLIDQNILASMAPGCRIEGTATDFFGLPVVDIRVRLHAGTVVRNGSTDKAGHYEFPTPTAEAGFNPATDKVSVELVAEGVDQLGASIRFQVFSKQFLGGVITDAFQPAAGADCKRDFDFHSLPAAYTAKDPDIPLWPDVIEMYQQTWRAWQVAEVRLGAVLDYGLPLGIFGWCDPTGPLVSQGGCPSGTGPNAFYHGSFVGDPPIARPYIALNVAQSTIPDLRTDQPLYHEFGHAFLADAFGNALYATPGRSGPVVKGIPPPGPHAGYYANYDSGDSWIEGFADYYRLMVRKHVDGVKAPTWVSDNLELDKQAWLNTGKEEEWALAGLLLDFEDGPDDYPVPNPVTMTVNRVMHASGYAIVDARVPLADAPIDTPVTARLLDASGNVVARGSSVVRASATPGMGAAWIYLPDVASATQEAVANVGGGVAGGAPCLVKTASGCDDDPIDLTDAELWATIRDRETSLAAYPHIATIQDLYLALGVAYGGDRDANGVDDVAQIFVAHGLFGDTDGGVSDHAYQPGEEVGATSHRANPPYAQMVPRYNTVVAPEKLAAIDTGSVDAEVIVNVIFPGALNDTAGYGYVATKVDGRAALAVPAPGTGATLALIAVADGYEPALLGTVEADRFWVDAESHRGDSFLAFSATLTRSSSSSSPSEAPGGDEPDFEMPLDFSLAYVAAVGGVALMVLVALVVVLRRRRRARS
jgi:hypothetical protein